MFDIEDRRQRQTFLICFPAHSKFSSPATKIFVLSNKSRAVCARPQGPLAGTEEKLVARRKFSDRLRA